MKRFSTTIHEALDVEKWDDIDGKSLDIKLILGVNARKNKQNKNNNSCNICIAQKPVERSSSRKRIE